MDIAEIIRLGNAQLRAIESNLIVSKEEAEPMPVAEIQHTDGSEYIQTVTKRKNRAFGLMNRLHAQLCHFGSDSDRLSAALQILDLEREVQACWKVIDHYTDTGEVTKVIVTKDDIDTSFKPADYSNEELLERYYRAKRYYQVHPNAEHKKEEMRLIQEYFKKA